MKRTGKYLINGKDSLSIYFKIKNYCVGHNLKERNHFDGRFIAILSAKVDFNRKNPFHKALAENAKYFLGRKNASDNI